MTFKTEHLEIWPVLAGLGLFLFGMHLLEESVKQLAGRSFKKFLRRHTENPISAIVGGTVTTAVLQSSSLVILIVMSFTSAGIIGLGNGIGIILGANLGTTFTGWLVSLIGFKLNIQSAILPVIALGGLAMTFLRTENLKNAGRWLMGFGILFFGLGMIKDGLSGWAAQLNLAEIQNRPLIHFFVFGLVLTAAIQSSSAGMAIFLSALSSNMINLHQAAFLVMGADIGTTVTALLGTIKGSAIRKKTGLAHFYINLFQIGMALIFYRLHFYFLQSVIGIHDNLILLVGFHSLINLAGIFILAPLLKPFTGFIDRHVSSRQKSHNRYLLNTLPSETEAAIEALTREAKIFAMMALRTMQNMLGISQDPKAAYPALKEYENEIASFYLRVQQHTIQESEARKLNDLVSGYRRLAVAAKEIKDVIHNFEALTGSASESKFRLAQIIRKEQEAFYLSVSELIENLGHFHPDDIARYKEMSKQLDHLYNREMMRVFNHTEGISQIDYSSLMNLVREVNHSNESLITGLHRLLQAIHQS